MSTAVSRRDALEQAYRASIGLASNGFDRGFAAEDEPAERPQKFLRSLGELDHDLLSRFEARLDGRACKWLDLRRDGVAWGLFKIAWLTSRKARLRLAGDVLDRARTAWNDIDADWPGVTERMFPSPQRFAKWFERFFAGFEERVGGILVGNVLGSTTALLRQSEFMPTSAVAGLDGGRGPYPYLALGDGRRSNIVFAWPCTEILPSGHAMTVPRDWIEFAGRKRGRELLHIPRTRIAEFLSMGGGLRRLVTHRSQDTAFVGMSDFEALGRGMVPAVADADLDYRTTGPLPAWLTPTLSFFVFLPTATVRAPTAIHHLELELQFSPGAGEVLRLSTWQSRTAIRLQAVPDSIEQLERYL